ncbi:MAG: GerMN domain-containing protein [Acidimicrobiales bacterium]|nr:GerMN domain-containing protein [Acidimicrobiales bacterium]
MRLRVRMLAVALLALSVAVGACTVSTNEEPVEVSSELFEPLLTTTSSTTTTLPGDATKEVTEYFIRTIDNTSELTPVSREVAIDETVQGILNDLFSRRPDTDGDDRTEEEGLSSAIPEGAELASATVQPGTSTLVVDVRGVIGDIQGSSLTNALAQIVWTATESDDVDDVTFQNDGQKVAALTVSGENTEEPVDRRDYPRTLS